MGPACIAGGPGAIWSNVQSLDAIVRIDAATGKVRASIPDGGACTIVAATDTDVCASGGDGDGCATGIVHISATTNVVVDTLGTGVLLVASLVALRPHPPRSDAT